MKSLFPLVLIGCVTFLTACNTSTNESITPKIEQLTQTYISQANAVKSSSVKEVQYSLDYSAHWLTADTLLVADNTQDSSTYLVSNANGQWQSIPLTNAKQPSELLKSLPHLQKFKTLHQKVLSTEEVKTWLKSELFVVFIDKDDNKKIQHIAYVQTGQVIDALYTQQADDANEVTDLGATIQAEHVQFNVWAPTAQQVELLLFNQDKTPYSTDVLALTENKKSGVWSAKNSLALANLYYQLRIKVYHPATKRSETIITTDPYSLSLSTNSEYSQIVDLNNKNTQPQAWLTQQNPTVEKPEDNILYETHIRDFSAFEKQLSQPEIRGKYLAFTEKNSDGIKHLKRLKKAGLNNIHLLPAFDIGTVNEDKEQVIGLNDTLEKVCRIAPKTTLCQSDYDQQATLKNTLAQFDTRSDKAQALVSELRTYDDYNWGYDPFHYTVPEGSYAVNPEGINRIVEFRQMVQSLHNMGFRVIMDVVYNHTHSAGLNSTAVLDKIVPNYYHRLDPISGEIAQSTCCDNTATERVMMAKLMTDSLVTWARDYKIDGFRFDLMGHQPKSAMLIAREAVRAVDADTYFYGEGWNFGEVANNQQFVQASQLELAGTEIGTFSDRLRDAVRGHGMGATGDDIRRNQGIGNGLSIQPNELNSDPASQAVRLKDYQLFMDQLRIGLAGNLANFPLTNAQGKAVLGKDIPYGDQPTGYALDPADTINYVSKHDNQTLWDNNQYRNDFTLTTQQRVRMHSQSLSFVLLAQGIPFLHMGAEFLRSKSFLRDSYDYSDWFNGVDFSQQTNFYNVGLPPAAKDRENWALIGKVLQQNQGRDHVTPDDIQLSSQLFEELLAVRTSSSLFSLGAADDIIKQVSFLNTGSDQQTGLIVMRIESDQTDANAQKENFSEIVVVFNTAMTKQTFAFEDAPNFSLHPIQQASIDPIVKTSKATEKGFNVPALSYAVFVKY